MLITFFRPEGSGWAPILDPSAYGFWSLSSTWAEELWVKELLDVTLRDTQKTAARETKAFV